MEQYMNIIIDGRFQLLELIGEGSFGEVWRATDLSTGEDKAVKICVKLDRKDQEDFMREYELTSTFHHQNLLKIEEYGVWKKQPYLIMKYLPNGSAANLIGTLSPCEQDEKKIWSFIYDVASGLDYLHSITPAPVVHQDIKPANILIDEDGHFVISDFGISKKLRDTMRTQSKRGNTAGAAAYMAPERFSPHSPSIMASDIWSLGASIYELAEGVLPFGGMGGGVQNNGLKVPHLSKGWSKELDKIVRSCLALKPYDRKRACEIKEIAYNILHPVPIMSIREKIETNWKHISHNRKYVFAVIVLIFAMTSLLYMSNSCRKSIIIEPPITDVEKERLIYLADLLDSIQPDEVGALFDNVLYYKKDTSFFFVDSIGKPIAGGKAFDDFKRQDGVVKTIRRETTTQQPLDRSQVIIPKEVTKAQKVTKEYYGLISKNGKELLPCDNDEIGYPLIGIYTYRKLGLWGCISDSAEILKRKFNSIIYGGESGLLLCSDSTGYALYNMKGEKAFPVLEAKYRIWPFSHGYTLVQEAENNVPFFINKEGRKILIADAQNGYTSFSPFDKKMAKVSKLKGNKTLYGLINLKFTEVLPCDYEEIGYYNSNAVIVKENGQWKCIDYSQNLIATLADKYDASLYIGGFVARKSDKHIFLNGKYLMNYTGYISDFLHDYYLTYKKDGSWYIINSSAQQAGPFEEDDYFHKACINKMEFGYRVKSKEGWGLLNKDLQWLTNGYKDISDIYGDELLVAKKNILYGYINKNGSWIIKDLYDSAGSFDNGFAIVKYNGNYGVINKKGEMIISNEYDGIKRIADSNLFVVQKANRKGIVDVSTNSIVVPCEFENDFEYMSGNRYPILKNGKLGFYTNDGRSTLELSKRRTMKQGNQAH